MIFDNHDERIKYYELILERKTLEDIPVFPLPDGYRFVMYKSGDRDAWIDIEKSAKEFKTYEAGLKSWNEYYGGKDDELVRRMVFIDRQRRKGRYSNGLLRHSRQRQIRSRLAALGIGKARISGKWSVKASYRAHS